MRPAPGFPSPPREGEAAGRDACRAAAAFMPAVTRSLISEDSSSAMAAMIVNMARPMGLAVSIWSWTLMNRTPR